MFQQNVKILRNTLSILILSAQIDDHLLMLGPKLQAIVHGFKAIPIKPPWPLRVIAV